MRRAIVFIKAVVVLYFMFTNDKGFGQCCTPTTTNLVVNGGFEQQDCYTEVWNHTFFSDMDIQCTGSSWGIGSHIKGLYAIGTSNIQSSWTGSPHSGNRYFVGDGLWGTSTVWGTTYNEKNVAWSQDIPVVAGKTYQFKVYYYNEQSGSGSNGNAPIGLGFDNANPVALSNYNIKQQWTELCARYTATVTGTVSAKIYKYNLLTEGFDGNDFGLDDIEFREINPFELATQPDVTICQGQSVTLAAQVYVGSGNYAYTWSSGQNTSSILVSPSTTTEYSVEVKDLGNGCTRTDIIKVNVIELKLNLGDDVRICLVSPTTIKAYPTGGSGNYSYNWNTGAITPYLTLYNNQPGSYNVLVTDNVYGCTANDNITASQWQCQGVKFYQNDESLPTLSHYNKIIAGRSVTSDIPVGDVKVKSGQDVTFKGGESVTLSSGFYTETGATFLAYIEPGCVLRDLTISKSNNSHCVYTLEANTPFGSGNYTYVWSTGETTKQIVVAPATTTTYSVTVTDVCLGATASVSYTLETRYIGPFTTLVPNLVTRNGDGVNDTWIVADGGKQEYAFNAFYFDLEIEDRWGGRIYKYSDSRDPNSKGFKEGDIYWPATDVTEGTYWAYLTLINCTDQQLYSKTWIHVLGTMGSRIGEAEDTTSIYDKLPSIKESNIIKVSPNPSQGKIKIEVPGNDKSYYMYVEDIYGKMVYERQQDVIIKEVDLKCLKPGLYYLTVNGNSQTYSTKIIISE